MSFLCHISDGCDLLSGNKRRNIQQKPNPIKGNGKHPYRANSCDILIWICICMYSWMKNSNLYVSTALVARAAAQPQHSRTLVMQKTVRLHFVIKLQTAWKIVRNIRKTICVRKSIRIRIHVYQWYIFFNITHVQHTKKNCKKKGLHQCRIVQGQVADQYQCCCYLHLQPISLPRSKYQRRSLHSSAEKRDLMDLHKSGKQTW